MAEVKERPMLFSGSMVRAILENRKTMTRRAIKRLSKFGKITEFQKTDTQGYDWCFRDNEKRWHDVKNHRLLECCPYGQPGDRLWVREAIRHAGDGVSFYSADNSITVADAWPWKRNFLPPMHCPRGLSRILLEIVSVRVERLQDISEDDAKAEGAPFELGELERLILGAKAKYRSGFIRLWQSINGRESWDANPWVWVIEFRRLT